MIQRRIYSDVGSAQINGSTPTPNPCSIYDEEIIKLEKEYTVNNQLLATHRKEIENLPPEASSKKMKLTSETFMIAAKLETAQNWIKIKKNEKIQKKCSNNKHN